MKCFVIFALAMASAASADDRKTELLNLLQQGVSLVDPLQNTPGLVITTDKTASCYGETFDSINLRSPLTATTDEEANEAFFVAKYPNAINNRVYKCVSSCDTTTGPTVVGIFTSTDDLFPMVTETPLDFAFDSNTDGCTGGFSVTTKAVQNGNLFVYWSGRDGVTNGKMTCTEQCGRRLGFETVYSKMTSIFDLGGGRRLEKYIRGGARSE